MRSLLLAMFVVFVAYMANAQSYHPLIDPVSNIWHYTANWIPVKTMQPAASSCDYEWNTQYSRLESVGDTIINGTQYTIIDNFELWAGFVPCRFGYLREDTANRKVYFLPNDLSPELLMYDFSLNQGDQLQLDFTPFSGVHPSGLYYLDTVFSINTTAGIRNLFELRLLSSPFYDPVQWIEGVGSPGGLAYLKTSSFYGGLFMNSGCNDGIYRGDNQLLVCRERAGVRTYFDSCAHNMAFNNFCFFYGDSCFFYNVCGSLNEIDIFSNIQVSPNPFRNTFQLEFESLVNTDIRLSINDLAGRLIKGPMSHEVTAGTNIIPISLDLGGSGVLLLRIEAGSGESFHRMIVKTPH